MTNHATCIPSEHPQSMLKSDVSCLFSQVFVSLLQLCEKQRRGC